MHTPTSHTSRLPRALRLGAAALAALALSGCVPSRWEGATAVLVVTPLVLLVVYGVLYALLRFGRWPLPTSLRLLGPPALVALLSLAIGLFALAHPPERSDAVEWMGPAFVFYGSSFLCVFLLVWRAAAALVPERAVDVAIGTTALSMLAPALLAFVQDDASFTWTILFWALPGYAGVPTLVVLLAFVAESWRRRKRIAPQNKGIATPPSSRA